MSTSKTHSPAPWFVMADPVWKGKHPLHDARFITTSTDVESYSGEGWRFEDKGEIICTMPDAPNQKANAALIAAAPELFAAARKTLAFLNDLSKSNPGYMGKLALQDYAQWNEAMIELPRAIAHAEGRA